LVYTRVFKEMHVTRRKFHDMPRQSMLFVGGLGSITTQRLLSIENNDTALFEIPTNFIFGKQVFFGLALSVNQRCKFRLTYFFLTVLLDKVPV